MAGVDLTTFRSQLEASFPWLNQLGLSLDWFRETAATITNPDEFVSKLRQTPQYKARFPAIRRADGSIRMDEAAYLRQETTYRQLLRQFGYPVEQYENPTTLVGFFDNEIDPNELKDRLEVYEGVKTAGTSVKDAFYVYAGLDLTDDDLFEAVVDPAAAQRLSNEYNAAIASSSFDYSTFIARATDLGLRRAAETLDQLRTSGAVTGQAVQQLLRTDPGFARQVMDVLYTGGSGDVSSGSLSLQELTNAFEEAMIGAAASSAGLSLPTKDRIAELRMAGVNRAQAQQAYRDFGQFAGIYRSAVERARGTEFGQDQFERASFLGDSQAVSDLRAGLAYEQAQGKAQGTFRFDQDRTGTIVQQGLRDR
jgi:hypothetical protein